MGHSHGANGHCHAPQNYSKAFAIGIGLNSAFVILEIIYGYFAESLALMADAGHNASDVLGLLLSWSALALSKRKPSPKRSYGFRRSTILAALGNAIFLLIAVGAIAYEAIGRFFTPASVAGHTVMVVAGIGILINAGTALLFMSGRKGDLNISGAYMHMAADAAVSLGVLIGGAILSYTGWVWIDPVISLLIVAAIVVGTWSLLTKSIDLAMDAVPEGIDPEAVKKYFLNLPGVTAVHDLHIWGMSTTEAALTAHIIKPTTENEDGLLSRITVELEKIFHIGHATVQVERSEHGCCNLVSDDVV